MTTTITYGDWEAITATWVADTEEYVLMKRVVTTTETSWSSPNPPFDGGDDFIPPTSTDTPTDTYEYSVFIKDLDPEDTEYWRNLDDEDLSLALAAEKLMLEHAPPA